MSKAAEKRVRKAADDTVKAAAQKRIIKETREEINDQLDRIATYIDHENMSLQSLLTVRTYLTTTIHYIMHADR